MKTAIYVRVSTGKQEVENQLLILIQTNFSKEGMLTSLFPFGISSLVLLVIFFLLRMVNIAGEPHGGKRGKKYKRA